MKYTLPVIFALAATTVAVPTAGGYGEGCNSFPGHRDYDGYRNGRKDFDNYRGRGDFDRHDHGKGFNGKKGLIDVDVDVDINGHKKNKHFDDNRGKKGLVNVDVDVDIKGRKKNGGGHFDGHDRDHYHGRFDGHDGRKGHYDGHGRGRDYDHDHRKGGRFDVDYYRSHGKGRKCVYPTFVDSSSLVVDVDVSVLGLLDIDIDIDLDLSLNRVRNRYPKCKAFYCCPSRYIRGKRIGNNCYRHGH